MVAKSIVYTNVHQVLRRLREERILRNESQTFVAAAVGVTTSEIYRLERFRRNIPFQRVVDYADYLGFDLVIVPKGPRK